MPKRRILFTSHTANFHKFNRPLMRMLRGKLEAPYDDLNMGGWQVDYACACEEKVYDADNVYTVDFSRSPVRLDKHLKAYRQLKKILAENHYDAIHTHTPVGSIITRLAARSVRKKGTKVIYTSHGFHFYEGAPKKNWMMYFKAEKMAAKYTDLLITINHEDYKNAKKYFDCPVKMINGVGIDVTKFHKNTKKDDSIKTRKELKLKADDFVVSYPAEFQPNKNHQYLLESVAPLIKKYPQLHFLFMGYGPLQEKLEKLSNNLGIADNIHFLGYINNVDEVLRASDMNISISIREGLGLGALEGVLCGCQTLVSDNRGHRDVVGKNTNCLFKLDDPDELREKLEKAITGKEKYYITFDDKFSLRSSLTEMRKIYTEILG